jgi:Bacterial archaeo-eukaryotic release factor family 2
MSTIPTGSPLLRLGRLDLNSGLRALRPGSAGDLVVTATVEAPQSQPEPQYAWDVAWADAVREASRLGADQRTAQALATGAGDVLASETRRADDTRVVVAAHGEVLLARWLPTGAAASSVRIGPLPYLREVAVAAARRPAHVVLLTDRDGSAVIAHTAGDSHPARRFEAGARPGLQHDPHPGRHPAQHHGERHVTDREPESGGERNAEFVAGRVAEAAADVGAHIVLGAGDQPILDAVSAHLPGSLGPVITIDSDPVPRDTDARFSARIGAALDGITAEAIYAVADLIASSTAGPEPAAVRGIGAVTEQLAQQQVAVLLVAAGSTLDEQVWTALRQDAIVAQLPARSGPLAGQQAAALLRRGAAS